MRALTCSSQPITLLRLGPCLQSESRSTRSSTPPPSAASLERHLTLTSADADRVLLFGAREYLRCSTASWIGGGGPRSGQERATRERAGTTCETTQRGVRFR